MLKQLLKSRRKSSKENWTQEQWLEHLLDNTITSSERNEIIAIFSREGNIGA